VRNRQDIFELAADDDLAGDSPTGGSRHEMGDQG
jgi:hypothetical protein